MSEVKSELGKNIAEVLTGVLVFLLSGVGFALMQELLYDKSPNILPLLLFYSVIPCILSTLFGVNKNRGLFGFILGFFFSWVGVIVIGCFKTNNRSPH